MKPFNLLLDLLFPKRCLSCGRLGKYFCSNCAFKIKIIKQNICPICEKKAIYGATHFGCQTKYTLDGLTSIFFYQGPIKKAIKTLKFKPWARDIAKALILLTQTAIEKKDQFTLINRIIEEEKHTLVPVPLHWWRERWRGFNQAEILGERLVKMWSLNFIPDLLVRKKQTQPQYELKGRQRKENVKGAFEINEKHSYQFVKPPYNYFAIYGVNRQSARRLPRGSRRDFTGGQNSRKLVWRLKGDPGNILLFDDVWTTGATLKVCASVLKRAGVKKVWGLTLAR